MTKFLFLCSLFLSISAAQDLVSSQWVDTWSSSPQLLKQTLVLNNQTLRQVVRISIGGDTLRLKMSNLFGAQGITLGAVHVAVHNKDSAFVSGTDRSVLFRGKTELSLAPGEEVWSDPIALKVQPLTELVISTYLPGSVASWTFHSVASQIAYISPAGNFAGAANFPLAATSHSWFLISNVSVDAKVPAIVALGDSITDGINSTQNSNTRWPDILANRLSAQRGIQAPAVLNQGISGNRILNGSAPSNSNLPALSRFRHDVLSQEGVKYVIVLLGINDIGMSDANANPSVTAQAVIDGHRQLIAEAHKSGLIVFGATLTPIAGSVYDTDAKREMRTIVNKWIRTGGAYDAVIDFDGVTRDPANVERFLPAYDSGDHLHPNSTGYKAMGQAIDLSLFSQGT